MKLLNAWGVKVSLFALACSLLLSGCSPSTTKLVHGYELEHFNENGKYYVNAPNTRLSGGGVFDGTVEKLGWNDSWLIARVERLYRGDTNGWYALNFETKEIIAPLTFPYLCIPLKDNSKHRNTCLYRKLPVDLELQRKQYILTTLWAFL